MRHVHGQTAKTARRGFFFDNIHKLNNLYLGDLSMQIKKTRKQLLNEIIRALLPILVIPVLCFIVSWSIFKRIKEDNAHVAVIIVGCFCFASGQSMALFIKFDRPIRRIRSENKQLTITFDPEGTRKIFDLSKYLEHTSFDQTVGLAMSYLSAAVSVLQNKEGEIVVKREDGTEDKFDPVSLEERGRE